MAISRRSTDPRRGAKGAARARKQKRADQRAATPVAAKPLNESPATESSAPAAPEERLALVERLQGMVERQIAATEAMLPPPATPDEAERNSRALASLLRTLRELKRLEAPPAPSESADDDDIPYDVDELRRELSRKLEALVAGREGAVRSDS
jgi:hypothetical protein